MTAANFSAEFPGAIGPAQLQYTPGDSVVYRYQVNNTEAHQVSAKIIGISNPANTIGSFLNTVGENDPDQEGFGGSGTAAGFQGANAVPEPGAICILAIGILVMFGCQHRIPGNG